MSAPNIPSFDDLANALGNGKTDKPKLKIGDSEVEFDPNNAADIQTMISNHLAAQTAREQELRDQLDEARKHTYRPPEAQPNHAAPTQPASRTPKQHTAEEIAAHQLLNQYLGDMLGVENFTDTLKQLAGFVQIQHAGLQHLAKTQQEIRQEIFDTRKLNEVASFQASVPDYVDSEENAEVIENYLKKLNLPPTRDNMELAYLKADRDGRIQHKQQQQVQQTFNVPQQQPQVKLPSLGRNGNTGAANSPEALLANFRELPLEEMDRVLRQFER